MTNYDSTNTSENKTQNMLSEAFSATAFRLSDTVAPISDTAEETENHVSRSCYLSQKATLMYNKCSH